VSGESEDRQECGWIPPVNWWHRRPPRMGGLATNHFYLKIQIPLDAYPPVLDSWCILVSLLRPSLLYWHNIPVPKKFVLAPSDYSSFQSSSPPKHSSLSVARLYVQPNISAVSTGTNVCGPSWRVLRVSQSLYPRPLFDRIDDDSPLFTIQFFPPVLWNPYNMILTVPYRMC